MAAKNLRITIPQPCTEDWAAMTPRQQGRHCSSCNKILLDFSAMTDAQLSAHFKNYKGSSCGRFNITQLNRNIPITVTQRLFRPIKYIAASLLAVEVFSHKAQARDLIDTTTFYQQIDTINADTTNNIDTAALPTTDTCVGQADTTDSISIATQKEYKWLQGDINTIKSELLEVESWTVCGGFGMTVDYPEYPSITPLALEPNFLVKTNFFSWINLSLVPYWFSNPKYENLTLPPIGDNPSPAPVPQKPKAFSLATALKRLRITALAVKDKLPF